MSRLRRALVTLVVLSQVVACPSLVWACTGITIKPKDGSVIFARTLEFAVDLKSNIIIVPRGKKYVGTAPGDKPGLSWKTKYGIVGANAFDLPVIVDGLNEKGLTSGCSISPASPSIRRSRPKISARLWLRGNSAPSCSAPART